MSTQSSGSPKFERSENAFEEWVIGGRVRTSAATVRLARCGRYAIQLTGESDRCGAVDEQRRHGEPIVGVGLVHVRQ